MREHRVFESWLQLVLAVGVTITLVVALGCAAGLVALHESQLTSRRTGFQNRAAICAVAGNLRMTLPDVCLDPNVTRFYDPTSISGGVSPSAATCAIAKRLAVEAPGCS